MISRTRPTRAFRSVVQDLPDITVPTTVPGYDGLLPITELDKDLIINMPWWPGVQTMMQLQAGWKLFEPEHPSIPEEGDLVGTYREVTAAEAGDSTTVFKIVVPKALLVHGEYLLNVRTRTVPGNAQEWTAHMRIEVDTVSPGGGALPYLKFNPPVEATLTITDDDIIDGQLPAFLAHYEGIAPGDEVVAVINGNAYSAESVTVPNPVPDTDYIALGFSHPDLLAFNGGFHRLGYTVQDKAGNKAQSRDQFFTIDLMSKPENLLAPIVPLADDGLINDSDARTKVQVLIPAFDKVRENDEIVVHWGNQVANPVKLDLGDIGNDPFIGVQLSYELVADAGSGTLEVKYEVLRSGTSVAISPEKTVVVDLTLIGGPDPDPETPEHENILPPTIFSSSGQSNTIPPEDFDQPATAVIAWLAKDGAEIYQINDKILLTWGDQVGTQVLRTVQSGDVSAKVDLELTVPASIIAAQGSGSIAVTYTASRVTSVSPFENTALSPSQAVVVTSAGQLPGSGILASPTFPVLNQFDAIGPNELINDTDGLHNPVRVATDYTNGVVGDTIELFFVGYDELIAGSQLPDAAFNPPAYELRSEDITRGYYEFKVPAQYHYVVCSRGAVEAHVIISNIFGSTTSEKKRVFCDVKLPSWEDCKNRP